MSDKQTIFQKNVPWEDGGLLSYSLPKVGISKITIIHNTGTPGGGSYVANTAIESIIIYIDGKPTIIWDGEKNIAGQPSMGIACLREVYKQFHNGVAMQSEMFIVELPDALPKNKEIQLVAEMALMASMGITISYNGTFDITFETKDRVKNRVIVPQIRYQRYSDGALIGSLMHYLPALSFKLRTLILVTYDGTTLSDTTYSTAEIGKMDEIKDFNGSLSALKEFWNRKGVSLDTGFFILSWPKGIVVPSDTFLLDFYATTAGTAKKIHAHMIAY